MVENERLRQNVMHIRWQLEGMPQNHPKRAELHAALTRALQCLFEQSREITVLREAITACRTAISLTPPSHPEFDPHNRNLGRLLLDLLTSTTDLDPWHLAQAVEWSYPWRAGPVGTCSPDASSAVSLHELASALLREYQRTDDLPTLRDAVSAARRTVEFTQPHDPAADTYRETLALMLWLLSGRTGDVEILEEASGSIRRSLSEAGRESEDHSARRNLLGLVLKRRYELTGDVPALREAAEFGRAAVANAPDSGREAASFAGNLADALRMLSERTRDLAMARDAVFYARKAIGGLRPDDPEWAGTQAVLGSALVHLADRTGDEGTAADATREIDKAVTATSVNHPDYLPRLNVLYRALMNEYGRAKDPALLERALEAARNLVGTAPSDHPERGKYLSHLSTALRELYLRSDTDPVRALDESIEVAKQAVASTLPNHPDRADCLTNLGDLLQLSFGRTEYTATLRESVPPHSATARMSGASISQRIGAAQRAALADLRLGRVRRATAMIRLATELLPQLGLRDVDRADREHRVSSANRLPATAAATAIAAGLPGHAVELLEQTRGVVFAGTLDTRDDAAELRAGAPDLLPRFQEIRDAINAADHEITLPSFGEHRDATGRHSRELAARRVSLNEQWDALLDEIRHRPGLAGFQRPTPITELCRHADRGPVVYVTAEETSAHALVVRNDPDDPARTVHLPAAVTRKAVVEQADAFRTALRVTTDRQQPARARREAQQQMLAVLTWTWTNITEPVLDSLGHTGPPPEGRRWSRVWWCPVGVVTMLPLHAAGRHEPTARSETVMDRVISSYTPTLRALAHARREGTGTESALVVAVPDAPDCPPLDGAAQEAGIVGDFIPGAAVLPAPGVATDRDTVVEALRRHGIVHLACHGYADLRDPSASRLLLHDHAANPLTLHAITRLDLRHARLAYLSACSTTDTNQEQADEATHLTAAFQLAGYRSVIGTLWPINDRTAITVAQDFYTGLTADRTQPAEPELAAEALHHAVRRLRDKTPALPSRWAAYIHSGT
ncbi:CHAT domain-containing protein [Streptomyces sp. OM5714]|uniref:CHAT domain-containing protein n=1 Tax=Streptomyces sp. OM5714 TaxID=2602736 RepID=UPI0013DBEA4D|nr:CHAT domain-containing protein [Streptomyces sp. OM5714]